MAKDIIEPEVAVVVIRKAATHEVQKMAIFEGVMAEVTFPTTPQYEHKMFAIAFQMKSY